jgi:hypothetical protein
MKKLKLDLDALEVETFEAERAPAVRGTVQANFTSGPFACQDQCYSADCSNFGCASDFGCASEHCSGWECGSLSGCVSYEVINCTVEC